MMTNMKHTQGPWNWVGQTLVAGRRSKHLLYVSEAPGLGDEAAANLALIKAAPELLEALQLCVIRDQSLKDNAMVMQAIAKAEGRS